MNESWEKAGEVAIESGAMLLHDVPESELDQACREFTEAELALVEGRALPKVKGYIQSTSGQGVILNGFGGDGVYPVYIRRNQDGLIVEARILFASPEALLGERVHERRPRC